MSFTLRSLPRRGNTPHFSRPTTLRPEIALVAAESPSVRMRVHSEDLSVPAQRASSNLGRPRRVVRFFPSVFLASRMARASRTAFASSRSPSFMRPSTTFPSNLGEEPNLLAGVVKHSLVCDSKLGFTIVAFTKKTTESLSCPGLISTRFFFAASQKSLST